MTDEPKEEPVEAEEAVVTPEEQVSEQLDQLLLSLDADEDEVGTPEEALPPEEETRETKETPAGDKAEQEEVPEEYERSLSALRRDGLPPEIIDQMTQEQALDYGAKRLKVQADTDNAFRELQEKSSDEEQAAESPAESATDTQSEPAERPAAVDLDEAIKPFEDIFGTEAANALRAYSEASQPHVSNLQNQMQYALGALEKQLVDGARSELSGQYPDLATDEGMQKVNDRMQSLVKTGEYTDINPLMKDAARIEFSGSNVAPGLSQKDRLKAAGQPMTADGADIPGNSLGAEERQDALLDALEGGMDVKEASRLYG